jgi:hypothetical protein
MQVIMIIIANLCRANVDLNFHSQCTHKPKIKSPQHNIQLAAPAHVSVSIVSGVRVCMKIKILNNIRIRKTAYQVQVMNMCQNF